MKKPKKTSNEADLLRQKAEQLLISKHSLKVDSPATEPWKLRNEAETIKLLHELEVHQIELEMQNQQLLLEIEKAETSAEKYANLYDFAPSGYFSLNCEGEICKLNFNGAKLLHRERSKLINTQFNLFIEPTTRSNFNDFLDKILETNTKQSCEVRLSIPKKPAAFLYIESLFLETEQEYMLTAIDVTKRKEAEQRAKDIDAKWKTLFQDTPKLAVKGYDKNGNIIYWNKAAEAFYGYTAEEAIGSKLTDLIVPEEAKTYVNAAIAEMLRTKIPTASSEAKFKCKNGATIEVFSSHTYVQNPDGEPEMYCIDVDLSESKKAEADLIKAKEKAEESDRLKSAFLANMSHEIRTPMNGILGFADLLKEPNLTGEQQQDYIKIIEQSGTRMLNIINSIMNISKIESGVFEVNKTEVNINETIKYMYTFFKPEVEAKGIEFSFKNALPLKTSVIHTDKEKLIAILTNLVKNSIKFTQKGSIAFGYIQIGENLEFYVKDTGIGIADDRQKAIFERFIQEDIQDKLAFQGAGLGLSISKAFVEMLGGKLWMKSIIGRGSTFYFSIPYSQIIK